MGTSTSKVFAHRFAASHGRAPLRRTGFNFSEVLFAVMILGIGFIMIAAIFPVALQQTRQTGEEVVASTSARGGVNFVEQVGKVASALPITVSPNTPPYTLAAKGTVDPATMHTDTGHLPGAVYSFRDERILDITGALAPAAMRDQVWAQISGNLILPSDNRLAWVAFYKRGATYTNTSAGNLPHNNPGPPLTNPVKMKPDAFVQVFVLAVQMRNRSVYDGRDLNRYSGGVAVYGGTATTTPPSTVKPCTLEGRTVFVKLIEGDGTRGSANADPRDQLWFFDGPTLTANPVEVAAADEGAFVIISDDQFTGDNTLTRTDESNGAANGRIYRLGEHLTKPDGTLDPGKWALAPGWDMDYQIGTDNTVGTNDDVHQQIPPVAVPTTPPTTVNGLPGIAFLVGRGPIDPTNPANGFEDRAQDVAVYTGIVPAN